MDLLRQANIFNKLCSQLESNQKKSFAQASPFQNRELTDFAYEAMRWEGEAGASADKAMVNSLGQQMYDAIAAENGPGVLAGAQKLDDLLSDGGGGSLGSQAANALRTVQNLFNVKKPAPAPVAEAGISPQYYQLLTTLEGLAKESVDPMNLARVREQYADLTSAVDNADEQLEFLGATVSSGKASQNPTQRNAAMQREKELNSFTARFDRAKKTIERAVGVSTAPVEEGV